VIWCAGRKANPLTKCFPLARDRFGRLPVTPDLKIDGLVAEFAAGDVARFAIDGSHSCVMSCQHGRPMGRFAGHNVVCDLLGAPMLPLTIEWYTTILDLGGWGAVYTEGRDRRVVAQQAVAKRTKEMINRWRIYPSLSRDRWEIPAVAAPIVQMPPAYGQQIRPPDCADGSAAHLPASRAAWAITSTSARRRSGSPLHRASGQPAHQAALRKQEQDGGRQRHQRATGH
jgi:NADH dehydrogenase